jgi:hypothetical protein
VTFTITEFNSAATTTGSHYIWATVPAYTTVPAGYDACTGSSGSGCTAGGKIGWIMSTPAGQTASRQFSAIVSSTTPPPNGTVLSSTVVSEAAGGSSATSSVVVGP